MRKRLRITLLALALAAPAIPLIVQPATAASVDEAPSASQLIERAAQDCQVVSKGRYATDEGERPTVSICKAGKAFVWQADMDIDCDGVVTSKCNNDTDEAFQAQTSFDTSKDTPFQADKTRFFVIPLPSSRFDYERNGIKPGSVGAVIFEDKVVYAVFADEGPEDIIGEASFATAKALGIDPDPSTGGTDAVVTYIVFPGEVPSPVESNTAIAAKGEAAAAAFIDSSRASERSARVETHRS